jgi:hypothetical protein
MWRSVLAILLVPSLLWSQNSVFTPPATQNPHSNPALASVPESSYQPFTQLQTIRRGTMEKAAVLFSLGSDPIVSPRNCGNKVIPLKLEFGSLDGIIVSDFQFPPDCKTRFAFQDNRIRVLEAKLAIRFKVRALPKAALGEHVLKGKLTYQVVRGNEVLPLQDMDVQLPLTVVDHDAATKNSPENLQTFGSSSHTPVPVWILMPVIIPAVALMVLFCVAAGWDCMD